MCETSSFAIGDWHWLPRVLCLRFTASPSASREPPLEISTLLLRLGPCCRRRRWRRLWPRRPLMHPRRGRFLLRRLENRHYRVRLRLNVDDVAFRSGARVCLRLLLLVRHVRPLGLLRTFGAIQRHRRRPATDAWASLQVRSCRVASALARDGVVPPTHLYYTDLLFVHRVHVCPFQR